MRAEHQERIPRQRCQSRFQHVMVGSERLQELRSAEGGQLALTSIAFFLCKNKGLLPAQSRVHIAVKVPALRAKCETMSRTAHPGQLVERCHSLSLSPS